MLEYNPIPTNKSQFKEGTQIPSKKRIRNKKYKNVFNEIKKLKKDNKETPPSLKALFGDQIEFKESSLFDNH